MRNEFQFHYGTIKRRYEEAGLNPYLYFNSTMVRLKGKAESAEATTSIFQFHYGTIKS